ncbi:MAG: Lhr family helicase, partial [Steroidobacteraceae bacterium]
ESEGFAICGAFTPGHAGTEWCERRLLARIHRYTIRSLREQIEPVASADFMRFLLEWQGLTTRPRPQGAASLERVLEQLEGFELPAIAWEADVLPSRLQDYDGAWLDSLCLSGRMFWARLQPPARATAAPVRATPMALLTRRNRAWWQQPGTSGPDAASLSAAAQSIAQYLQRHGASFFDQIVTGAGLLRTQVESALGELVAAGVVSADSFGGLRALLLPLPRRRALRGHRGGSFGLDEAGRWSLVHETAAASRDASPDSGARAARDTIEAFAWLLLRRYGVVFRRLLTREPDWCPAWHELLRAYRRLEAQGLIRGGRFVAGMSGEQYALPDAIGTLRSVRARAPDGALIALSAADPLNLAGIVTPGARLTALAGNRVLLQDGVAIASLQAGEVQFHQQLPAHRQWQARSALVRKAARSRLARAG